MVVTPTFAPPVVPKLTSITITFDVEEGRRLTALLASIGGYTAGGPGDGLRITGHLFERDNYHGYSAKEIRDGVQNRLCAELNKVVELY